MPSPAVVALVNQKGGVGKTTVTLGLAAVAAQSGLRVLVCDLDAQGNASSSLGRHSPAAVAEHLTVRDVLVNGSAGAAADGIQESDWEGVSVLPSDRDVALLERDGIQPDALRRALDGAIDDYDLVLLDCPPSLGLLSLLGLAAATQVVIVAAPAAYSVAGVLEVAETVRVVCEGLNPHLVVTGVLANINRPTREAAARLEEMRDALQADVLDPPIPLRAVVEEAAGAGAPITAYGAEAAVITAPLGIHLARILNTHRRRTT